MSETQQISDLGLVLASSFIVLAGAVSLFLRLGIASRLVVASLRTVVQLALVGLLLHWIFDEPSWWLLAAVVSSMMINAGIAAVRRTEHRFKGIWSSGLVAVTLSSSVTTVVVLTLVIQVEPWHHPRYLIPILGMVLGNALTGLSLSLQRLMAGLDERASWIEAELAVGASIWEACRPTIVDAVRTGLVPILNSMSVVGIVSLPGMMTGQILAGASPEQAVRYQIVVMFMLAGATSLGTLSMVLLGFRRLITADHQLALSRLRRPGDAS